jgi:predicted TIM-barrel fold metal-dependent hydrolase
MDVIGIRLRDFIGPDNTKWDNMIWGSDYPRTESTSATAQDPGGYPGGVPEDEQAKPAADRDPGIAGDNTARVYRF